MAEEQEYPELIERRSFLTDVAHHLEEGAAAGVALYGLAKAEHIVQTVKEIVSPPKDDGEDS